MNEQLMVILVEIIRIQQKQLRASWLVPSKDPTQQVYMLVDYTKE